jgi:peptide/nickel transport system ATP-binding protein
MSFLNPVMKVGDQISEAIMVHNKQEKQVAKQQTIRAMSEVGIPAPARVYDCYPHELSGGMKQRVLIAMAVWCDPSLVVLDEPTTALDVTVQAQIIELLTRIRNEKNLSLLLITHDLGVAAKVCDKIYVMYAGKLAETGDVFEVYDHPMHPYTQGLLQCALSIDEFKEKLTVLPGTVPDLVDPPLGCRFHPRCPYAMPVCSEKDPTLARLGNAHHVFCWLCENGHE